MARIGVHTVTGDRGSVNQDSCFAKVATTGTGEIATLVVCDGVGGFDGGELASGSVVHRFAQWFDQELSEYVKLNTRQGVVDITGIKKEWLSLLNKCNDALYQHSVRRETKIGTTFTGLLLHKGMYLLAQVGDSRCYVVTPSQIQQLSMDQTVVNREVSRGNLSIEEAQYHPMRNQLIQAVGSQNALAPEITMGSFAPGSIFVVCSDGLYEQVEPAEITGIFAPVIAAEDGVLSEACETAANLAISRGEQDDITVACCAMDAWAAVSPLTQEEDSETATRFFEGGDNLDFLDDGNNPTLVMEVESQEKEDTFTNTKSSTEASTAGALQGSPFDDDDEATVDSFEVVATNGSCWIYHRRPLQGH